MALTLVATPANAVDFGAAYGAAELTTLQRGQVGRVLVDLATPGVVQTIGTALVLGLQVGFWQGYDPAAFTEPGAAAQRAAWAADVLRAAQVPPMPHLVIGLDWEAVPASVTPQAAAAWIDAWGAEIEQAGYLPGIYVGPGQPLDGEALWQRRVYRYWQSAAADMPAIPNRGYCLIQERANVRVNGVQVDTDTGRTDARGGTWTVVQETSPPDPAHADGSAAMAAIQQQVRTLQTDMDQLKQALAALAAVAKVL